MYKLKIDDISVIVNRPDIKSIADELYDGDELEDFKKYLNNTLDNKEKNKEFSKLYNFPLDEVNYKLIISNSPPEFVNAIQRVLADEMDGYALYVNLNDNNISRTDEHINLVELKDNIEFLPLMSNLSNNEINNIEFQLDIINNTNSLLEVKAGDLSPKDYIPKYNIFFPSTTLIHLNIGCRLQIKTIKIEVGKGYNHARFKNVYAHGIWPLDRKKDDKTNNTTPLKHELFFSVNAIERKSKVDTLQSLLKKALDNIIERLLVLYDIVKNKDILYYKIIGEKHIISIHENYTIAKMMERAIYTLYPDIQYVGADIEYHKKLMTLVVQSAEGTEILKRTIDSLNEMYLDFRVQVDAISE